MDMSAESAVRGDGMKHQALTERIIGCVVQVHRTLGPGFVESIYHKALLLELRAAGLQVETEREVVVRYLGEEVGRHRMDLVVADTVVVELKPLPQLASAHYEQVRSYLRAGGLEVGLLVNFGRERADFRRIDSPPCPWFVFPSCSSPPGWFPPICHPHLSLLSPPLLVRSSLGRPLALWPFPG
jgi:GxxExxY protein